jgi:hypothetical protein
MAGVDIANQFPNSFMALAVRLGQSRFISVDVPATPQGGQVNTNISATGGTLLTVPALATYAVITAVAGALFATYDGSAPSATNFDVQVAQGAQLPVQGARALAAIKVFGTEMSVSYWS